MFTINATNDIDGWQESLSGFDAMSAAASSYVKKAPKQATRTTCVPEKGSSAKQEELKEKKERTALIRALTKGALTFFFQDPFFAKQFEPSHLASSQVKAPAEMNVPNYEEKNTYRLKNNIRAWYTDGSTKQVPDPYGSYSEVGNECAPNLQCTLRQSP